MRAEHCYSASGPDVLLVQGVQFCNVNTLHAVMYTLGYVHIFP